MFSRAIQRNLLYYDPYDEENVEEFDNGTLFFVTVNSNRTSNATPSVDFHSTINGIQNMSYEDVNSLFSNDKITGDLNDYIEEVIVEGAPEVGAVMNRVHAHLVVSIRHNEDGTGHYKMNIDRIKDIFKYAWNIPDVYVNVKAVKYDASQRIDMIRYLDIYKQSVIQDYTNAPYAFFM